MGYIKHSSVLFFVGTYSVISKYEFIKLLPHDDRVALGSYADILNELLKLAVGTAVWCFFEYMLPFRLLQQHAFKLFGHSPIPSNSNMLANSTSIKSLDAKPQWFSEFKWLYALIYPFLPAFIIAQTGWLQLSAVDPDSNVDTLGNSQWDAGLDLDQYDLYDELELTDIHLSPV
ncbi:hypothetical protein QVD99_005816 [Batrachochytrium dendrobatidis]|nr:hypothetical protein QVD99_005816 [Batrachochytrium dendrobatidis]